MARGPAYPFVNLEEAVELARLMYQYTRRSPADADAVIDEAWHYSPTSSSGKKIVAALGYFGLIDSETNIGEKRVLKLTDRAYRILIDDANSNERRQALKDAALSPKAYLLCWTRWGKEMPPSMRSNLIFGEGFVESTVDGFISDYKKTIEYAGLLSEQESIDAITPEANSAPEGKIETVVADIPDRVVPHFSQTSSVVPVELNREFRSDVFSLDEGTVQLIWPKALSRESFQDLSDWLDLVKRKIERAVEQ